MPAKKKAPKAPSGEYDHQWAWLKTWCEDTTRKLNLLLLGVRQIMTGGGAVSPELEAAFNELAKEIQNVDDKVPDQTNPPTQETSQ